MLELITSTTIMGPILITKITSEQLPSVYNGHYFGGYWKIKQHVKLGFNCKISWIFRPPICESECYDGIAFSL